MSKPLSIYGSADKIAEVVRRRIENGNRPGAVKGLGYWAARDYMERQRKGNKASQNNG